MPLSKLSQTRHRVRASILPMLQLQFEKEWRNAARAHAGKRPHPPTEDSAGYIAVPAFLQYLHELCQAIGDDAFVLRAISQFGSQDMGQYGYILFSSPTLRVALTSAERFLRLQDEAARITLKQRGALARLEYALNVPNMPGKREDEIATIGLTARVLTLLRGKSTTFRGVDLSYPRPSDSRFLEDWFGCTIRYGCKIAALTFDALILDEPLPLSDPGLNSLLLQHASRQLVNNSEGEWVSRIEEYIVRSLPHGSPDIVGVSQQFDLSVRTLQRRLARLSLTFNDLLDRSRHRLALALIDDQAMELTDIAFLLGYSEFSAFGRAFKRWTGNTPREHRRLKGAN